MTGGSECAQGVGLSDRDLLASIAVGEKEALGALYHRHVARLLGVARRTLAHHEDAEDVVHDVFLEVWRYAEDYDPTRGTVASWLLVRTRSRSLDRLKSPSQRRRKSLDHAAIGEDESAFGTEVLMAETRDPALDLDSAQVWSALHQLPLDQRAVVELAYFEGLTLIEVGESLGIPAGTVKSRLSRAVAALRELFA
ncbi:MAG TPA: sigma-70 family RNA polymerase sigma factor [Polyangium sp.]|nr:sigma-70 family RNA polymerase sigma factor [Polyangium sp.]